jgi:DNA-binding SARP family transcriptional activator/tetratricopeptide (TPR) repeat protein
MQVRLLGPVDVVVDGQPRLVKGLRRKAVLAALALHHGDVVSVSELVDVVWGDAAPSTAVSTLQNHVSYLRTVLNSKAAIRAQPPGYVLDLGAGGTDVQLAERLLREGRQSADPGHGAQYLHDALALWRGRPLADLAGLPWLETEAERLDLLRVHVSRAFIEARLRAGQHALLVPELEQIVTEHPLDEQIHAHLMLALYRTGRQADALAAYHALRRTLDEELGIVPGHAVRALEAAILRQDPLLEAPGDAASRPALAGEIPAQLPSAVPAFAGRRAELASLDALLPAEGKTGQAGPPSAVITAVSGTAGVGKTALAVHWAHQMTSQFPDGQLYVNLQGFGPGEAAVEPEEAVRGFLAAFGVPVARIPADLAAQAALYRSVLAGKRVLVLLDNARDVEQVRPLLPGSAGCLAIVTSRRHLTGLVATEGAYPLTVGLLSPADARDLLTLRLGLGRVVSEPAAVDSIIAGCARLPLALTIAAARAAISRQLPLKAIAAELREATRVLDPFHGGDLTTDVRAVFSWSYRALSCEAAGLFRLMGLNPGPDIAVPAAASLAGITGELARASLTELTQAHLLAEHSPGRYYFHDLLRSYAAEQADAQDSAEVRYAAIDRVLDHYLHSARRGAALLEPQYDLLTLSPPRPGVIVGAPATEDDAVAWFRAEHATLVAAVHLAAATNRGTLAWQLASTLSTPFLRRGSWNDHARVQRAAMDATRLLGDAAGEAHAIHGLGLGYARSGRFDDAYPCFLDALRLFEMTDNYIGQARIHSSLTWLSERGQRPTEALGHAMHALDLYRAAGHGPGQAMVLNDIGFCYAQLGDYQQAIAYCERGLAAVQEIGERNWEAATWDSLGFIYSQLGSHNRSFACYRRAIGLYRDLGDRFNEADTLDHLGDAQDNARDPESARQTWLRALRIYDEIDHPDGDQVRLKLWPASARRSTAANTVIGGHRA